MPMWICRHKRRRYIVSAYLSSPLWVKQEDFKELRRRAVELSVLLGVPHSLDHIIPVQHPYVCGLTVPWNMQVLTHKANMDKGNKWSPDQQGFEFEKQLELLQ